MSEQAKKSNNTHINRKTEGWTRRAASMRADKPLCACAAQILVKQITLGVVSTGNARDAGRYAIVDLLPGIIPAFGAIVEAFDRKGGRVRGKLESMRLNGASGQETTVIDTFTLDL